MAITQAMLDVAYNRGYLGYKTDARCPYLGTGSDLVLKNEWYRGKHDARDDAAPIDDDLNSYMTGLSQQNAAEDDVMVTLRRLEAKLDQILAKLG